MTFVRISVPLLAEERDALRELAGFERRRLEAQAAWIIKHELELRGLLAPRQNHLGDEAPESKYERSA